MRNLLYISVLLPLITLGQRTFFRGIGVFGSLTESAHYYRNTLEDTRNYDDPVDYVTNFNAYSPRSHVSKEGFNWGAGLFAEFLDNDRWRWQTEFTYMKKSVKERDLIDPYFGTTTDGFSTNKYTHIQWNNYLKSYNPIGWGYHWYAMGGVRLEYLLNSGASAYSNIAGNFPKFWFSGDLALGYEFPISKRLYGFAEYHWNPDIIRHKHDHVKVRNRTFELRAGVMFRPRKKRIDDCNAPKYKGPAY